MRYQYHIIGRNVAPLWGLSRRRQGRQMRVCLDCGRFWVALYFRS